MQWAKGERPFVVHYAGCTFCAKHKLQKLGDSILQTCTSEMVKALVRSCLFSVHNAQAGSASQRAVLVRQRNPVAFRFDNVFHC